MTLTLFILSLLLALVPTAAGYDNIDDYGAPVTPPGLVTCIIDREGFALGYSEQHEQAAWVCYKLTREEVLALPVKRKDWFAEDPKIITGSARKSDYLHSGYDRGHLAPFRDMAWSETTAVESFYMSNMSPQDKAFNRGIWKDLEEAVRGLAAQYGEVYVVTGPVLPKVKTICIGESRVTVPDYFFKAVFCPCKPERMWGFIVPNRGAADATVWSFCVTVDDVEEATGYDLFPKLETVLQETLESTGHSDVDWAEDGVVWLDDDKPVEPSGAKQEVPSKVKCIMCGGRRRVPCNVCGGSGKAAARTCSSDFDQPDFILSNVTKKGKFGFKFKRPTGPCRACKGKGKVACPLCGK